MDLREYWDEREEPMRTALDGLRKSLLTAMPVIVAEDSDGHTVNLTVAIKGRQFDKKGKLTHVEFPMLQDVPIHFPQGGGVVSTYAIKKGDEGTVVFAARHIDAWHQSGGVQQSIDTRLHSLSDAFYIHGVRSNPRKIKNNSTVSSQHRSDDKGTQVLDIHPKNGMKVKNVDPSDDSKNPFLDAKKFFEAVLHPSAGHSLNAVDGAARHIAGVLHDEGAFLKALDGLHKVLAHPQLGALLSAANGEHIVHAHPDIGVLISSAKKIALSAPQISLPSGSIGGGAMAEGSVGAVALSNGAAAQNTGELGGDLSGTLPDPIVVGCMHIKNADQLGKYANDAAAMAGGVSIGQLYINTTYTNCLAVRLA